jgi:hypothetical protein
MPFLGPLLRKMSGAARLGVMPRFALAGSSSSSSWGVVAAADVAVAVPGLGLGFRDEGVCRALFQLLVDNPPRDMGVDEVKVLHQIPMYPLLLTPEGGGGSGLVALSSHEGEWLLVTEESKETLHGRGGLGLGGSRVERTL